MEDIPFDVAVLGGGPAGMATALALCQAVPAPSVIVVAQPDGSEFRVDESVPQALDPLLRQLGVLDRFQAQQHRQALATSAAWSSAEPVPNESFFTPHRQGWQLERVAFDR